MNRGQLIYDLQQLKVQTSSLACMGCQHEDNCGIKGCALIRAAVEELTAQQEFEAWLRLEMKNARDRSKR